MEEELPYQPITFIKTGIIGGDKITDVREESLFDFRHKHIIIPKSMRMVNPIFYVLFHTPSIYNWLITVPCRQTDLLSSYISYSEAPAKSQSLDLSANANSHLSRMLTSLSEYVSKWEVVKVTFASTIYVNKVKQAGNSACIHLAKTQQKTTFLGYHSSQKQLSCSILRCK